MEEFLKQYANKNVLAVSDLNRYCSSKLMNLHEHVSRYFYLRFHVYFVLFLGRATIMQHETSNIGKGNIEAVSVAIPAVMRAGGDGKHFEILS